MNRRLVCSAHATVLALIGLVAASSAHGHRLWLLPNAVHSEGRNETVVVDAVASEDLFVHELPLPLGTVTIVDPRGREIQPIATINAKNRNSLEIKLDASGAYRASNLRDFAFARYKLDGEQKSWRGKPDELATVLPAAATEVSATVMKIRSETFFSKDTTTVPHFAALGQGIELQPLTPVTDLSDGERSRFRVYLDGKPAAGVAVSLLRGGNRHRYKMGEVTLQTDAAGEFTVTWPEPGVWWMGISNGDPDARGSLQRPALRQGYSATFEVLPR